MKLSNSVNIADNVRVACLQNEMSLKDTIVKEHPVFQKLQSDLHSKPRGIKLMVLAVNSYAIVFAQCQLTGSTDMHDCLTQGDARGCIRLLCPAAFHCKKQEDLQYDVQADAHV